MEQPTAAHQEEVTFEIVDGHIAVVTLNRPRVRNAINGWIAQRLDALVKSIEDDPELRVAILASSHPTVFCAGADLREIAEGRSHLLSTADHGFAGFVAAPRGKPWIAAVQGAALAGGCEIALACDMIVASEDATFGLPEVKRGLFAAAGGVFRLPRALPRNIALEVVATGDPLTAQQGHLYGLVNHLVAPGRAIEEAIALARRIAANAPLSVVESLKVARQAAEPSLESLRRLSAAAAALVFASDDAREGPQAFLEKRPARWSGR